MNFRAEVKINGESLAPKPKQHFNMTLEGCHNWAKEILKVMPAGTIVEVYKVEEILLHSIIDDSKKTPEPPK